MANSVTPLNISAKAFVIPTSRYANSVVEYYTDNKYITFETYKRTTYVNSPNDQFMVISKGREYRPDLVSNDQYGLVDFWWKIMEVNGIFDIMDFKAGTNIRLPANIYS